MNLDYQMDLVKKHLAKADQCSEYGKYDDAQVHLKISRILLENMPSYEVRKSYEQESLSNLASALS